MKRIGLFVVYDADGIIDATEEFLLSSLADLLDRFIVIINGTVCDDGRRTIEKYTKEVVFRANDGFDGGAYKDILLNYLKKEELAEYDELLLVNDTFYGPFYPWKEVFERAEKMNADFWGLTKHVAHFNIKFDRILPEHVQGYFVVFTKNVFSSEAFYSFWNTMPDIHSHDDAILNYEVPLTSYFKKVGFTYGVYTDTYPQKDYLKREESIYATCCRQILEDFRFPILKKKNVVSPKNPQSLPSNQARITKGGS